MALTTTDVEVRGAYEADVSGLRMLPDSVARPASEDEVLAILREATATRTFVTPAGAQTSTTGASITDRGVLLSMRACAQLVDLDPVRRIARVQSGALVGDIKRAAAEVGLTWPPDPTSENECTVGGAVACNASGARTLRYGPTRSHVAALRVALAGGGVHEFRRTHLEKNAAGYHAVQAPIDWFIGSEGTLGVVLEAELSLQPLPERVVGLAFPFRDESTALAFVAAARESRMVAPRCLEYFDSAALDIARAGAGHTLPAPIGSTLVYAEQTEADDVMIDAWLALAEASGAITDDIAAFEGESGLARARAMRHAVPAAVNERGARLRATGGRRVSTDWAVPYRCLARVLEESRTIARSCGIEPPMAFGHAGNGHPHQSYLPADPEQLKATESAVGQTLERVIAAGGTIAAEHGIGKVKRRWLPLQMSTLQIDMMRAIKRELDPAAILAPGNLLP